MATKTAPKKKSAAKKNVAHLKKSTTKKALVRQTVTKKAVMNSVVENSIEDQLVVGIRELRQDASRIMELVKSGRTIIITERGKPIASVKPIIHSTLQDLIDAGIVTPATRKYDPRIDKPVPNPKGIDYVAALLRDRAEARY